MRSRRAPGRGRADDRMNSSGGGRRLGSHQALAGRAGGAIEPNAPRRSGPTAWAPELWAAECPSGAYFARRELDGFRHLPLEVQPEGSSVGEGGDLQLEIAAERGFPAFGVRAAGRLVETLAAYTPAGFERQCLR
jgi:hypothetical protein